MKILHIVTHFHPFIGGLENMALALATEQAKKHDVSIVTLRYDKNLSPFEEINGLKIYRFPSFEALKNQYSIPNFGFSKQVNELNPNIIFTHTRFFMTSFLGSWDKPQNTKWIHVEHGQNFVKSKNLVIAMGAWCVDQTFGRYIFNKADKIVVLSEEGQEFVSQISSRKNGITIIPNGVKIPPKSEPAPRKNKAIFFGRCIPEKGVVEVIEAAKNCPNWSFDIYGEGHRDFVNSGLRKFGAPQKKLELTNLRVNEFTNIHFHGNIPPHKISEKIQSSDLVILPSWSEGNSLAVLEAAANSRPILATPVGQNEKIISSQFLVPIKDARSIIKKLKDLENDVGSLEKEGQSNLEKVKDLYSFKKMINAYEFISKDYKKTRTQGNE